MPVRRFMTTHLFARASRPAVLIAMFVTALTVPPRSARSATFCGSSQRPLIEATWFNSNFAVPEERVVVLICTGGRVVKTRIQSETPENGAFPFSLVSVHRGTAEPGTLLEFNEYLATAHVASLPSCRAIVHDGPGGPEAVKRERFHWFGRNTRNNLFYVLAEEHAELPVCNLDTMIMSTYIQVVADSALSRPDTEILTIRDVPLPP